MAYSNFFVLAAELLMTIFFPWPAVQPVSLALGPNCKSMGKPWWQVSFLLLCEGMEVREYCL